MERRREPRIKRRLTCEFFHGTTSHRGIILDLGPAGIFIRTNAVLSPGTEIDVHLAASVAAPAMTLRGCVVRRRAVPATLTTLIQPGIGVRLLDMPREFGLLTGDCELDEAIQTDYDFTQTSNSDQSQGASSPPVKSDSKAAGGERDRSSPSPPQKDTAEVRGDSTDTQKKRSNSARADAKKEGQRELPRNRRIETPKPPRPPIAVLVGGSDLDAIASTLQDLGATTIRCGPYDPQLTALDDACLLVVSGSIAMSDPIPVDTDLLVGIAVCGDVSETVRSQICEVSWRVGWKSNRGRLLDVSRAGCCLLVENSPKPGAKITIKIPSKTVGGKALKLQGKVLRSTPNAAHSGSERTALGVILDGITPAARKILAELCDRWSESPPELSKSDRALIETPAVETRSEEILDSKTQAKEIPVHAENASAPDEGDPPTNELQDPSSNITERPTRRGVFEREIVQIDDDARVVQALLGRDISVAGIRVARQLGLSPGGKLRLALFDTPHQEPLILSAEVSNDDSGSGLFLHFVDLSTETTARIEEIVTQLPAVESIDPHGDANVIPAGVVSDQG